jgi:Kae1-associated kinase Bud32
MDKIFSIGAEAVISLDHGKVKKSRVKKSYRIPALDEKLRKHRTRSEAKILEKLQKIILVPKLFKTSESEKELVMEYIQGEKLSETLEKLDYKNICRLLGETLTKLHNNDIIHGDLTTSNLIFQKKENKLFIIDFGLSFYSKKLRTKQLIFTC